uniref:Uncharacterized protein n=1 Tax=Setaria digitata TaxID=48799 RepID=A0A915PDT2_9BILA
MCRSLKNDLTVDPGLPMFFLKDKLDKPEELDKYALDKESVRVKYKKRLDELQNKKPSIVCALGTLQLKETFVQVFEIDVASPAEDQMTVECCCDGNHLCNHDMNSYQAFNLLPLYMENPLCSRSISSFRFIFLSGPHQYCAVHYDFVLRKVVSLYINVNMDLPREGDYEAYQQLGCRFIEAKIRPHIPIHCKNEVYKRDDTLLGRLIYMCTCPGKALSERLNESACDVELEKKITGKAMADTKKIGAPSCYYINLITETENYAPTGIGMFLANNITVRSNESFWCYDQLILTESHGKLIANWSSGEVKVTMYPEIRETCIRMSTENGAYVCASFRSGAFCCCKNYNDIPCNKQKQIQSIIMQDLVPFHSVWVEKKEQLRHWQNFCIKPDRNTEKCKSPMGCYLVRHATSLRTVSTDLPAGCISNIDQPLLQKYPYLALCSNYLKNGFATRCFYTDTRDAVTNIPLVTCCCNKNRYNDCPLPAFTPMLGYTYNTSRNT